MLNMDKFRADALRYYLMTSPVMQAEDIKFNDDESKDAHNKLLNILLNTFKFLNCIRKIMTGRLDAKTRRMSLIDGLLPSSIFL